MTRRMQNFSCCSILISCLLTADASAQSPEPTTYFPLEVGNTWTYFQVLDPPGAPPDTLWRGPYTTAEALTVNDTLYFRSGYPFAPGDTLRDDGSGKIWARIQGKDVLLFDFTLEDGAMYPFHHPGQPDINTQVTVTRDFTVEVGAGRFEDCIGLSFDDPNVMDDGMSFAFAPDVGIVYAYGNGGDYEELYSAEVSGEVITTVENDDAPPSTTLSVSAYPNPFASLTTITFPIRNATGVEASVYDLLGRRVADLGSGRCDARHCAFEWNGTGQSSGLYVVRMEAGGRAATLTLHLRP